MNDHPQNHLMPGGPGDGVQLPAWIPFERPESEHRAAHAAWLHTASRCVLLKFWQAEDGVEIRGQWQYELVTPAGERRVVVASYAEPIEQVLHEIAERVIREMSGSNGG